MSAVQNFQNGQQQLAQSMTAPLQAGQTQQTAPLYNQQSNAQTAHQQYQQQISGERQKQADLAKQMQQTAMQAGTQAIGSGLESTQAASNLKRINGAGRIQAKHPLDLLAIGIRGWKANKAQKKTTATAAQAKQDAYKAAQAAEQSKRAKDREEWLWKKEMESKTPKEAEEMTKARMEQAYLLADNEQESRGIAPEDRVFKPHEMAGQDIVAGRLKESTAQGTGAPVQSKTDISKEVGKVDMDSSNLSAARDWLDKYNPDFQGASGLIKGAIGTAIDFFGAAPESPSVKFMADRDAFRNNLYGFGNQLLKARSGAAVTKPEWDRFLNEYPLSKLKGERGFEVAMDEFITRKGKENYERMRTKGWVYDSDGSLVKDKDNPDSAPIIDSKYDRRSTKFYDDYNNADLPEDMYTDGDFTGFTQKGNRMRNPEKAEAAAEQPAAGDYQIISDGKGGQLRWKEGMTDWEKF